MKSAIDRRLAKQRADFEVAQAAREEEAKGLLKEGDIIDLSVDHIKRLVNGSEWTEAHAKRAGQYIVYKTTFEGGGMEDFGHGDWSYCPDQHRVQCRKLNTEDVCAKFYQTTTAGVGLHPAILGLKAVGRDEDSWEAIARVEEVREVDAWLERDRKKKARERAEYEASPFYGVSMISTAESSQTSMVDSPLPGP